MASDNYLIKDHARQRAFEREITTDQIVRVIVNGKLLDRNNDHDPYPRARITAKIDGKPLIVVVDQLCDIIEIVSVYID